MSPEWAGLRWEPRGGGNPRRLCLSLEDGKGFLEEGTIRLSFQKVKTKKHRDYFQQGSKVYDSRGKWKEKLIIEQSLCLWKPLVI